MLQNNSTILKPALENLKLHLNLELIQSTDTEDFCQNMLNKYFFTKRAYVHDMPTTLYPHLM